MPSMERTKQGWQYVIPDASVGRHPAQTSPPPTNRERLRPLHLGRQKPIPPSAMLGLVGYCRRQVWIRCCSRS